MSIRRLLAQTLNAQTILPAAACTELPHDYLEVDRRWHRFFCSSPPEDYEPSTSGGSGDAVAESGEDPAKDAEPQKKKGRRWTRAEKGSWANSRLVDDLKEAAVPVPEGIPIYDMRTDMPWHYAPKSKYAELYQRVAAADPDMLKMLAMEDYPAPYPGARSILRWETYMVLMAGPDHLTAPINKKAKCWVYLRDLQEETGLTDAALEHIALVCGPRYNTATGRLTLVSEKYPDREENRRDILDTLYALVAEGERVHPQTDPAIRQLQEERRAARERAQSTGLPVPEFNPLRNLRKEQVQEAQE